MKCATIASLTLCLVTVAFAQAPASSAQKFEAASIRVRKGAPQWKLSISGSRMSINSYTLLGLIKEAYNLQLYQIQKQGAVPLLSSDDLYDIEATAGSEAIPTREQFREMLQELLADRFHLMVHREMKAMPVYMLEIGRGGIRFQQSAPEADPQVTFSLTGENKEYSLITSRKMAMEDLANILSPVDERPVLDGTGLKGTWDIKLYRTPAYKMSKGSEPDLSEISIFTALQKQLGLKLEPQKGLLSVLVVDSAEKPTDN